VKRDRKAGSVQVLWEFQVLARLQRFPGEGIPHPDWLLDSYRKHLKQRLRESPRFGCPPFRVQFGNQAMASGFMVW
jgi:hypothetical protein